MFRRSMLAVAAALAVVSLAFASPAMASPTTCVVTPDPVSLSTTISFNVAANGLDPDVFYYVKVSQGGGTHGPYGAWQADSTGNLSADLLVSRVIQDISPVPGPADVKVYKAYQGGQVGATCGFTFVA
jgi:hypothetical protein